jgi:PAS domain S-box-containing protein
MNLKERKIRLNALIDCRLYIWLKKAFPLLLLLIAALFLRPVAMAYAGTYPQPFVLSSDMDRYPLGEYLEFLKDPSKTLSIGDIEAKPQPWVQSKKKSLAFGQTRSAYWFRFTVENDTGRFLPWYFEIAYPMLDSIDVYVRETGGAYRTWKMGDRRLFTTRDLFHRTCVLSLDEPPGQRMFYVRIESLGEKTFPPVAWSHDRFIRHLETELPVIWAFYGILVVMFAYNLIIFLFVRDVSYFYLALAVLLQGIQQMVYNGTAFQYLWPNFPLWANTANLFILGFGLVLLSMFLQRFMRTREDFRSIHRVFNGYIAVGFLFSLFSLSGLYTLGTIIGIVLFNTFFLFIIAASCYAAARGSRQAVFIGISFFAFALGVFLTNMRSLGILPSAFITEWSLQLGISLTVVLLSLGLADRFNIMRKRSESLNRELASEIAGHKRSEQELEAERERLSVTLQSIADGVITTDTGGHIIMMNRVAEEITGWSITDAWKKKLVSIACILDDGTGTACRDLNDLLLIRQGMVPVRKKLLTKSGAERVVTYSFARMMDNSGTTMGFVLVLHDMTEKVKIEEEFNRIQKLESIGVFAGGIAHDFNNILTAIVGNLNMARLMVENDPECRQMLDDAENAAMRARGITQQLLTFAKGGAPVKQIASIEELIKDSAEFVLRGSNVSVRYDFQGPLSPVSIDVGQISQVIQNLVINADQSMPDGGVIVISARMELIGADSRLPVKKGPCVQIEISDHGYGIHPDHMARIYDPFFTTKDSGSGLGLASAYSIVQKHDGYITAESTLDVGTTFRVYLPAIQDAKSNAMTGNRGLYRGNGRVLTLDDDPSVLKVLAGMLGLLGFSVDMVINGEDAIDYYRRAREDGVPYCLVILDLTIPGGMGGKYVMKEIASLDPGVRAIVTSGYSNDRILSSYVEFGFRGVLMKPYRIEDVSAVVRAVLESEN